MRECLAVRRMPVMRRILAVVVAAGVAVDGAGCDGVNADMSWRSACTEQANAYCKAIGYGDTGCVLVYEHTICTPARSRVASDAQAECIDEIDHAEDYCNALGCGVPDACRALWSTGSTSRC